MLTQLSRSVAKNASQKSGVQIKSKKYSTIPRDVNAPGWAPNTTVSDAVLANKEGHKTLAAAYTEAVARQSSARSELLSELNKDLGSSPFATVRNASNALASALTQMNSEVALDITKATLPLDSLDDILEAHEIAQLHADYAAAFANLPYVPTDAEVPIDSIAEGLAAVTAEVEASAEQLRKIQAKARAQLAAASANATNLMYSKADDILNAHPELEAQLEEEIKAGRWELLNTE